MNRFLFSMSLLVLSLPCFSQANYNVTDPEKDFKEAKEYFMKDEYSLAYPLLKALRDKYPENMQSNHTYLNQDIEYYYIVCGLIMNQAVAEEEAQQYIDVANNEPRQQILGYHLAKYYFAKSDFARAVIYYPESEITATSVVPPPISTTMLPEGSVIGSPAPMAATMACSTRCTSLALAR